MAERARLAGLRKDGATLPVEISLSPVPTASETFVLAVIRDATETRPRTDLADLARGGGRSAGHRRSARPGGSSPVPGRAELADRGRPARRRVRERLSEALDQLDDVIQEIRDYAFTSGGDGGMPAPGRTLRDGMAGDLSRHPGEEAPDGRDGDPAQYRPVECPAQRTERRPVDAGQRQQRAPRPVGASLRSASRTGNNPPPGPVASQRSASPADLSVQDSSRTCTRTSLETPPGPRGPGQGRTRPPMARTGHRSRRVAPAFPARRRSRHPAGPHRQRTPLHFTGPAARTDRDVSP